MIRIIIYPSLSLSLSLFRKHIPSLSLSHYLYIYIYNLLCPYRKIGWIKNCLCMFLTQFLRLHFLPKSRFFILKNVMSHLVFYIENVVIDKKHWVYLWYISRIFCFTFFVYIFFLPILRVLFSSFPSFTYF